MTETSNHTATSALQAVAQGGRLRVSDPTVRATISELARLGFLRPPSTARIPKTVNANLTVYRLRALAIEGWSPTAIAVELGVPVATIKTVRKGGTRRINIDLAQSIKDLYDDTPDTPLTEGQARRVARTALFASWKNRKAAAAIHPQIRTTL